MSKKVTIQKDINQHNDEQAWVAVFEILGLFIFAFSIFYVLEGPAITLFGQEAAVWVVLGGFASGITLMVLYPSVRTAFAGLTGLAFVGGILFTIFNVVT